MRTISDPRSNVDVLVIGAGPTGLGAAKRLNQLVSRVSAMEDPMLSPVGWPLMDDC
jgi:pyruvate/2-oxoglutarate dehydrogenase complex dihydrolipoamide dehydrogenase (E3) component